MKRIDNYICTKKPQDVAVYPTLVYVCEKCELQTVEFETNNGSGQVKTKDLFVCSMAIYEIPEYIDKLRKENEALNAQTTELQLALCEVYEMML